jgi:hypothetical protein
MPIQQFATAPEPGRVLAYRQPDIAAPALPPGFLPGAQGVLDNPSYLGVADGKAAKMDKQGAYWSDPIEWAVPPPGRNLGASVLSGIQVEVWGCNDGTLTTPPDYPQFIGYWRPADSSGINSFGAAPAGQKPFDLAAGSTLGSTLLGSPLDFWNMNQAVFTESYIEFGATFGLAFPVWDPGSSYGSFSIDGIVVTVFGDLADSEVSPPLALVPFGGDKNWAQHPRSTFLGAEPPVGVYRPGVLAVNIPDRRLWVVDGGKIPREMYGVRMFSEDSSYLFNDVVVHQGNLYRAIDVVSPGIWDPDQWIEATTAVIDCGVYA